MTANRILRRLRNSARTLVLIVTIIGAVSSSFAQQPIAPQFNVEKRETLEFVSARQLAAQLQIALKPLPGRTEFVVCYEDRCGLVQPVVAGNDGDQLVEISALAKVLEAEAIFSAEHKTVSFDFRGRKTSAARRVIQVGDRAPALTLTTLDGKKVSLADFRGRRVLINSWASWCGCRNDLPAWQKFYERHQSEHFEILSVAVDVQGPRVVRPYVEQAGVTFPVTVDETDELGRAFGLKHTPVSFLVDELGLVRAQGGGPRADFLAQVETILREPLSDILPLKTTAASRSQAELERTVTAAPTNWAAHMELALLLAAQNDFTNAQKHLTSAEKATPQPAEVRFLSGQLFLRQGNSTAALERFQAALALDPKNWRIRKQIWALKNPDKFYTNRNPDYGWQRRTLVEEKKLSPDTPDAP